MSLLNGLKNGYSELADFFNPDFSSPTSKNIKDSFDFYLVVPRSGGSSTVISDPTKKRRFFQVVAGKDDIEIYNAGFTNNVYGEQVYGFNITTDIDVGNYFDVLGFPLTEVFIYAQYKTVGTEEMSRTSFSIWTGNASKADLTTKDLVVGDIVETHQGTDIGDLLTYSAETYFQEQIVPQIFYIRTRYDGSS